MSEPMTPEIADALAAVNAATGKRSYRSGFTDGYKAGNDAAVAVDQPILDALQGEIMALQGEVARLRELVPPAARFPVIEGGKETPDA